MEAYSGVLMELELHELEFHAFFFFLKFVAPYSIFYKSIFTLKLDFEKTELQKRGISLISLGNGVKCWKVCGKGAFANFGPINLLSTVKLEHMYGLKIYMCH